MQKCQRLLVLFWMLYSLRLKLIKSMSLYYLVSAKVVQGNIYEYKLISMYSVLLVAEQNECNL